MPHKQVLFRSEARDKVARWLDTITPLEKELWDLLYQQVRA